MIGFADEIKNKRSFGRRTGKKERVFAWDTYHSEEPFRPEHVAAFLDCSVNAARNILSTLDTMGKLVTVRKEGDERKWYKKPVIHKIHSIQLRKRRKSDGPAPRLEGTPAWRKDNGTLY